MINPEHYDQINEALKEYLESGWSTQLHEKLTSVYGAEIAQETRFVYDSAMGDPPVDWFTTKMDDALYVVSDYLQREFPWLTEKSRSILNYRYIMTWK